LEVQCGSSAGVSGSYSWGSLVNDGCISALSYSSDGVDVNFEEVAFLKVGDNNSVASDLINWITARVCRLVSSD